jgi:hypothetical protein
MPNIKLWCKLQSHVSTLGSSSHPIELEEGGGQSVDHNIGMRDILTTMWAMPGLFKSLTNFRLTKFEELTQLMVPTIIGHVKFTKEPHHIYGRPSKLTPKQHLFNFILYMKHDNVSKYDGFQLNWSKSAMNDDGIYITFCINFTITDEI